ncbi:mechanosensitive ion channel family protein [Streptomyces sp. NBC_01190]|uniref:mechanosensitive ion channel family protein n=1 Tax=Streptomyces sp. NBC_01190 TaxID=2903767 RepID=UPI003870E785|nr:mechanosensitive ion channel [Streptomyces sp. NBC_01190]
MTDLALPHSADQAGSWVDDNWADWLTAGLRIVLIVVIAIVLRRLVVKTITKLIERMNQGAEAAAATTLGGLLVNAERRRQRSAAIGSVLKSMASFVILGTAALTVLSVLKINLAPLLASAGVAGVAIGFGARNLVTDFLSGVFMILEDQYGVGDVIDAGVASGTVVEVGLRVTKLRGDNGEIWYVRNGEVQRIGNLSQGWATAMVDVQVGAGEDLERARAVIVTTAEELGKEDPWDERLWEPVRVLGLESVGAESVVIQTQAKTMPGEAAAVARELRWRIKKAFDDAGIAITSGAPAAAAQEPGATAAEREPVQVSDTPASAPPAAAGAPKAAEPSEPSELANPANPADPADPANPADPARPAAQRSARSRHRQVPPPAAGER